MKKFNDVPVRGLRNDQTMKDKRLRPAVKICFLREADFGKKGLAEIWHRENILETAFHRWEWHFGYMGANEGRRLKELERFRDKCLNWEQLWTPMEVRLLVGDCQQKYNHVGQHVWPGVRARRLVRLRSDLLSSGWLSPSLRMEGQGSHKSINSNQGLDQ